MHRGWRIVGGLLCPLLLSVPGYGAAAEPLVEPILSAAELAALDRENAMWRKVDVREDVSVNLKLWRRAGFNPVEIEAIQPKLLAIWRVDPERNFGWLSPETVEAIREVDQEFIVRMRAIRLRAVTGIKPAGGAAEDEAKVNRLWRRAVLRVLQDDEVAEFRLMNFPAAQEAARLAGGLALTNIEQRELFQRHRDFVLAYGEGSFGLHQTNLERKMAELDYFDAIRQALGADRFAVFLERASSEFSSMRQVLGPEVGAEAAVDLWRLRQQQEITRRRTGYVSRSADRQMRQEAQAQALVLLGAPDYARYSEATDGRWLRAR